MHFFITLIGAAVLVSPALADDRGPITAQMQELSDAIAAGEVAVWDKYLDANIIFTEEDGTYKGKAGALKEITPLPKGLSGEIEIVLLSYFEESGLAVALFRQNEVEHYFGQTIHATYLTSTTWKKRADGWKLLAAQALAEKTDPPAINLPDAHLRQYAGTYKLKDSEATYSIAVSDGKLLATRTHRKPTTWNAEACDVFFSAGDPRIRDIFQRDTTGKVSGFVERREMWDISWVKTAPK